MKTAALIFAAALAGASAQICPNSAECGATLTGAGPVNNCDSLIGDNPSLTCAELQANYGCDCTGCQCGIFGEGVTDPPDVVVTVDGGGPGGGPGNQNTAPPPPDPDATHTEPPLPTNPPPPPIFTVDQFVTPPEPVDNTGTVPPPASYGVSTLDQPYTRTTFIPQTFTPFHTDGTHTIPPIEISTTTLPPTTTGDGTYTCEGGCAKDDHQGDGFCDDYNNKCSCDWDGGDCCGEENHYIYCDYCNCKDPAFRGIWGCTPKYCDNDDQQGDGYCDDGNNICSCNWDGGDCCGSQNHYGFCTECLCQDPTHEEFTYGCNGNCGAKNYIGDGFCDDENNNCGCDWDNGDCCGNDNSYAHCSDCFCRDPDDPFHLDARNQTGNCTSVCANQGQAGDGFCDPKNNVCGCDWDGGDCCGGHNSYNYCDDECDCLDPSLADFYNCDPAQSQGSCENTDWVADAYCDDGNNNCVCNWDGGDCCGPEHYYTYCDECTCKDPADATYFLCSGTCGTKKWKGDGYCDDDNNNCGCDWDGGDCCDHNAKQDHCTECLCLDPDWVEPTCVGACEFLNHVGDGYCDDGNNVCGCDWDAGDCCGTNGNATQYYFCQDCLCLDPDNALNVIGDQVECAGVCGHTDWTSDGFCDDMNNNCGCNWDGGDCCGDSNSHKHCTICACLDPTHPGSSSNTCSGSCAHSGWTGDGFCDDDNNNCGCDWDNGDCCGEDNSYNQCTECRCQDPAERPDGFTTKEPQPPTVFLTDEPIGSTPDVNPPPTIPVVSGGGGGITAPPDRFTHP